MKRGRPRKNISSNFTIETHIFNRDTVLLLKITLKDYDNFLKGLIKVSENKIELKQDNKQNIISLDPTKLKTVNNNNLENIQIKYNNLNCPFKCNEENYITDEYTELRCLWDHCKIKGKPYFLPIKYNNNIFYVNHWFCSLNCAVAYNIKMNDDLIFERYSLLKYMYNIYKEINPAPDYRILKKYGGNLTIEEYREKYTNTKGKLITRIINPPMYFLKSSMEEIKFDE